MKKVFEFALILANIISWISLFLFFGFNETKSKMTDVEMFSMVAVIVICWAVIQLFSVYIFTKEEKDRSEMEQSFEKEYDRQLMRQAAQDMEQVYQMFCNPDSEQ